jgi:hypothetical protein
MTKGRPDQREIHLVRPNRPPIPPTSDPLPLSNSQQHRPLPPPSATTLHGGTALPRQQLERVEPHPCSLGAPCKSMLRKIRARRRYGDHDGGGTYLHMEGTTTAIDRDRRCRPTANDSTSE